jgi:hypothetical protein
LIEQDARAHCAIHRVSTTEQKGIQIMRLHSFLLASVLALCSISTAHAGQTLQLNKCYPLTTAPTQIDSTGALLTSILHHHTHVPDHTRSTMYLNLKPMQLIHFIKYAIAIVQTARKGPKARQNMANQMTRYVIKCQHIPETLALLQQLAKTAKAYKAMTSGNGVSQKGAALLLCQKKPKCDMLTNPHWGQEYTRHNQPKHKCYTCDKWIGTGAQRTIYHRHSPFMKFLHRRVRSGIKIDEIQRLLHTSIQQLHNAQRATLRNNLSLSEQHDIVQAWFRTLNTYERKKLFAPATRKHSVTIGKHSYGPYRQGWAGLTSYSSLGTTIVNLLSKRYHLKGKAKTRFVKSFGRHPSTIRILEQLSGHKVVLRTAAQNPRYGFAMYNKHFIKWAFQNLTLPRDFWFGNNSYNSVYRAVFQRIVRLMIESYLTLHYKQNLAKERQDYLKVANHTDKIVDLRGINHLDSRFGKLLPQYNIPNTQFQPATAFGFWLRRSTDGTKTALWNGLTNIAKAHDKSWFTKTYNAYTKPTPKTKE